MKNLGWLPAIELGATVCKKTPLCENCPIAEGCQAKKLNLETKLPIKKAAAPVTKLTRVVLAIQISGRYVVKQVEKGQLMAGLYEFPYFGRGDGRIGGIVDLGKIWLQSGGIQRTSYCTAQFYEI